jgi:hypothetical protein
VGLHLSVSSTYGRRNGSILLRCRCEGRQCHSRYERERERHVLKSSCIHCYARQHYSFVIPYPSLPSQQHQSYQKAVPVERQVTPKCEVLKCTSLVRQCVTPTMQRERTYARKPKVRYYPEHPVPKIQTRYTATRLCVNDKRQTERRRGI